MGLIADIVESVKSAFTPGGYFLSWRGPENVEILEEMANSVLEAANTVTFGLVEPDVKGVLDDWRATARYTSLALTDPQQFIAETFGHWNDLLQGAYATLNVEVSDQAEALGGSSVAGQLRKLELGAYGSQKRLTAAITLINVIVVGGNAVSALA